MRILIAYDDSACARDALKDLELAGLPPEADVLVLSVLDGWMPPERPRAEADLPGLKEVRAGVAAAVEERAKIARAAADQLGVRFPGWRITAAASVDSPAWAIIKRAEGQEGGVGGGPADLVVVGSRGRGRVERVLLGSVAQRVVLELRCPVRIARGRPDRHPTAGPASLVPPPSIVLGFDGSADADAALTAVAERRWPVGTRVMLILFEEVGEGSGVDALWIGEPAEGSVPVSEGASEGVRIVERAAESLRARNVGLTVSAMVKVGDPKYGLVQEAAAWGPTGADCIFVGAKGVRGVERFLLGSVSSSVALNAHCSVEIVHRLQK